MHTILAAILYLPRRILRILFAHDIFISYAHKDGLAYANALDETLCQTFTTHLDTRDFLAGQNLSLLTRLRVRRSQMLIVVARAHALGSSYWVQQEVREFIVTGRMPILIDIDHAIDTVIQNPNPEYLSGWLAASVQIDADGKVIDPFLRINDDAPDSGMERLPASHVAQDIAARFSGDRVETRRLRIISATMMLLVAITITAIFTAYQSTVSARRATAEALANDALVAATGTNLTDGFLLDAADRLIRAHKLDATSNVLGVAAKIESLLPSGLVYPPRPFQSLNTLAVGKGVVYVHAGNTVHALRPNDLSVVQSWADADIGIVGIGNLIAVAGGFVGLTFRQAVQVGVDGPRIMKVAGTAAAPRPGGGFAPLNSVTNDIVLVDAHGNISSLPCRKPKMKVAWHGFVGRDRLVIAGIVGSDFTLTVINIKTCDSISKPLPDQPLSGAVVPGANRIILRSSQSAIIFDFDLAGSQTVFVANASSVTAIGGPAPGFAIGTSDGGVELFSFLENGTTARVDRIDKVLPGTVTFLAHDMTSNRLIAAGRRGFFVGALQQGVIVSVPLEVDRAKGTIIARPSPAQILDTFSPNERLRSSHALSNGLVFSQTNGSLRVFQNGMVNTIDWDHDQPLKASLQAPCLPLETLTISPLTAKTQA